ncbi:hypothetical protein Bealeia1_00681 [Candidatus Bealeia paramacronuclearis]|uniref:Uncharacterized protein n=1 Tax=Candidatus Bealeia paramacronuclearis TaxID=1921001 RepID=A0ABZ2C2N3_9PROT|nr:hypothetical protein [Candidatus Bealeia paramacronuclearis]
MAAKKKMPTPPKKQDARDQKISKILSRSIPVNDNKSTSFRTIVYAVMALIGAVMLISIFFSYPY